MSMLPTDPVRRGAVLLAFLALSGLYFTYAYVYAPGAAQVVSMRLRLERLEEDNRLARTGAAMGKAELEERLVLYQEHIGHLEELIPADEEVAALLKAISDEERKAQVEMTMMRPEPVEPGDFYDRLSYELAVRGGYHAVGSFIAAIASLQRIVAPENLAITHGGPAGADGETYDGAVAATFRISTYVATPTLLPDRAEPPANHGAPTS